MNKVYVLVACTDGLTEIVCATSKREDIDYVINETLGFLDEKDTLTVQIWIDGDIAEELTIQ